MEIKPSARDRDLFAAVCSPESIGKNGAGLVIFIHKRDHRVEYHITASLDVIHILLLNICIHCAVAGNEYRAGSIFHPFQIIVIHHFRLEIRRKKTGEQPLLKTICKTADFRCAFFIHRAGYSGKTFPREDHPHINCRCICCQFSMPFHKGTESAERIVSRAASPVGGDRCIVVVDRAGGAAAGGIGSAGVNIAVMSAYAACQLTHEECFHIFFCGGRPVGNAAVLCFKNAGRILHQPQHFCGHEVVDHVRRCGIVLFKALVQHIIMIASDQKFIAEFLFRMTEYRVHPRICRIVAEGAIDPAFFRPIHQNGNIFRDRSVVEINIIAVPAQMCQTRFRFIRREKFRKCLFICPVDGVDFFHRTVFFFQVFRISPAFFAESHGFGIEIIAAEPHMNAGQLIIHLHHCHCSAVILGIFCNDRADHFIKLFHLFQKNRMQIGYIAVSVIAAMAFHRFDLRMIFQQPIRQSAIDQFGIGIRSRTRDNEQSHFFRTFQKIGKIGDAISLIKHKFSFFRFMDQPRNIRRHGITSGILQQLHPPFPILFRDAEIMEFPAVQVNGFSVDHKILFIKRQDLLHKKSPVFCAAVFFRETDFSNLWKNVSHPHRFSSMEIIEDPQKMQKFFAKLEKRRYIVRVIQINCEDFLCLCPHYPSSKVWRSICFFRIPDGFSYLH